MTQLRELVSTKWGVFVSKARPVVAEWSTRGLNFANSLDTDGKAKYAFYQHVRDSWLNEPAVRSLCSRVSQYAFKDHPIRFFGTALGLWFVFSLFCRPASTKP